MMYIISETRPNAYGADDRPMIMGPLDTLPHLTGCFLDTRECFVALFLDTRHRLIDRPYIVSVGSLNASLVHPREVFREAIARAAAAVIIAHNHPSGNPDPSGDDLALTERLDKSGDLLGIALLDHLIIGHENHISVREYGWPEQTEGC